MASLASRATLRTVRSAPQMAVAAAAAAGRSAETDVRAHLRALPGRSGCAQALAAATQKQHRYTHADNLAHRACPPGARRATWTDYHPCSLFAASGSSVWVARDVDYGNACRSALARHARLSLGEGANRDTARHPGCPPALLQTLTADADGDVNVAAASNPRASRGLLHRLAADSDPAVRGEIASRADCPQELLEHLADDDEVSVAAAVASNTSCASSRLQWLANHYAPSVHEPAQATLRSRGRIW